MSLVQQSSPHARRARPTSQVMLIVILATLPGLLAQSLFFGWGNLVNVVWCILLACRCPSLPPGGYRRWP